MGAELPVEAHRVRGERKGRRRANNLICSRVCVSRSRVFVFVHMNMRVRWRGGPPAGRGHGVCVGQLKTERSPWSEAPTLVYQSVASVLKRETFSPSF